MAISELTIDMAVTKEYAIKLIQSLLDIVGELTTKIGTTKSMNVNGDTDIYCNWCEMYGLKETHLDGCIYVKAMHWLDAFSWDKDKIE
jgi:hypothetical protein